MGGWLSLTLVDGHFTKEVVILFCSDGVLDSSYSCGFSQIGVVGSKTVSFRINSYSSFNFSTYYLERVSSTSIDLPWTLWAFSVWVFAHCSSFITTLADSITILVLRFYTLYALLGVEYPSLSLFASIFQDFLGLEGYNNHCQKIWNISPPVSFLFKVHMRSSWYRDESTLCSRYGMQCLQLLPRKTLAYFCYSTWL